jgi:hypothetical protein
VPDSLPLRSEDIYSKFHKEAISTLLTLAKKKIPVKLTTMGAE